MIGGKLQAGVVNAFSPNSNVSLQASSTLNLNTFSSAILNLLDDGAGQSRVTLGSATLTIGNGVATIASSYSGSITGTQAGNGLTLSGPGLMILSSMAGYNTYNGPTTVTGTTLAAGGNNAFSANSGVQLNANATLAGNGYDNTIANLNSFVSSSILNLGSNPGAFMTIGNGTIPLSSSFAGEIIGQGGRLRD